MRTLTHPDRAQLRLEGVLDALANPVRLQIIQRLAKGEELTCSTVLPDIPASSATHHWRVLRENGLLFARRQGRVIVHSLRRDDLDARFPGLLDAVLAAMASESHSPAERSAQ